MQHRDINMNAITNSAIEVANQEGLDNLTMPKIAKKLGIRSQSLYNHVSNLAEIRVNMSITLYKDLKNRLLEGMIGLTGKEAIIAFFGIFRDFCLSNVHLNRLLFLPNQDQSDELNSVFQEVIQILVKLLNTVVENKQQVPLYTKTLMSVFVGFIMNEINQAFRIDNTPTDDSLNEIIELVFKSIK